MFVKAFLIRHLLHLMVRYERLAHIWKSLVPHSKIHWYIFCCGLVYDQLCFISVLTVKILCTGWCDFEVDDGTHHLISTFILLKVKYKR